MTFPGKKLWGGRFSGDTDPLMEVFNESFSTDKQMYEADLKGTGVYSQALEKVGILSSYELSEIQRGLSELQNEWARGEFIVKPGDEDIHTANERRLGEFIGRGIAGKVHTGRSRNDQVVTDTRLYTVDKLRTIRQELVELIQVFVQRAREEIDVLMPGYTHMQRAQPIRWSHWLSMLATFLSEDFKRLEQLMMRVNQCPLGAGALAGNPYAIDREFMARELGFQGVIGNSLTAVCDRDFVIEVLFWCSMVASHLSKMCEDLIIYSTAEFGFVQAADAYSTGSSLMPQKKNPDSLELIRGKSGTIIGHHIGFMVVCKGLPSTYNKDLGEDKDPLFHSLLTITNSLNITKGVISTLKINKSRMYAALSMDMLATDLADYLVRKGVPFRETHHISGEVVAYSEKHNLGGIDKLSLSEFKLIDPRFDEDVMQVFDFHNSVERRSAIGGTAKRAVMGQLEALEKMLN